MLLSAMSVLVVAQSSSEIPEGLMNNPVYNEEKIYSIRTLVVVHILSFQRDLVVLQLSILKLIIYSTGKVDRE